MHELFLTTLLLVGCGNGSFHSDADAMKANLGLDASVDKAVDAFHAATSANIPTQCRPGQSNAR